MREPTASRANLATEQRSEASAGFDQLAVADAVALMQREDRALHAALEAARPAIVAAIELVVARLARGGRLLYVGATRARRQLHLLGRDGDQVGHRPFALDVEIGGDRGGGGEGREGAFARARSR